MKSFFNTDEINALQASGLDKKTPYIIQNVSETQLSIARYFGGCRYDGVYYTSIPVADEIVRNDVLKWIIKYRKDKEAKEKKINQARQINLFYKDNFLS